MQINNKFLRLRLQRLGSNLNVVMMFRFLIVSATSFTKAWFKQFINWTFKKIMRFCDFVYKGLVQTTDLIYLLALPLVSATSFTKAWFKLAKSM